MGRQLQGNYFLPKEHADFLNKYVKKTYLDRGYKLPAWVVAYQDIFAEHPDLFYRYHFSKRSESIYLHISTKRASRDTVSIRFSTHNLPEKYTSSDFMVGAAPDGTIVSWKSVLPKVLQRLKVLKGL